MVSIITLLVTMAIPTYDRMILKARADEAKATIQAIAFAQERYHQEIGQYYPNNSSTIYNEQNIHENLKVDLSISNNFYYSIEGDNGNGYVLRATLRNEDTWDECGNSTSDNFECKQNGTLTQNSWLNAYSDSIAYDNHYLEFHYPTLLENDYTEEGISYENLYKDE